MNERIKELALEARIAYYSKNGSYEGSDDGLSVIPSTQSLEKFAQLIVRECVDIAYEHDEPKMSGPGMIIAGRIEKHFGVEEQTIEQDQVPLPKNREQAMAMLRVATFYLDTQK